MRILFCSLLTCLFFSVSSLSQLRLPAVISSGMVLQQNDSATFWGWGYNGQQVSITASWNNSVSTGIISNHGKWSIKIKTPSAGGPYTVKVSSPSGEIVLNDVLVGEVWLCSGQSNMEWSYYNGAGYIKEELPSCYNNNIRFFQVPRTASDYPQDDTRAMWRVCDSNSLKGFSAVGYYFGKKLQHDLNIPIGLINASWGGTPAETWTPAEIVYGDPKLKQAALQLKEVPWCPVTAGVTYNGMLSPIIRYNIAGALWYQGESNTGTYNTYAPLLITMIDTWRVKWKKAFPFYYVQIAPFKYGNKNIGALLQEQQTKVMALPNTGMVVITDLVDNISDIHPRNKKDVGARLANWALAETYHQSIPAYQSPLFEKADVVKDKLVLHFRHAPTGLMAKDKIITGFYISGEQEEWLPAEAKIEKNTIIVWNKNIKKPVHVRYGFGNTIIGNVFSKEGLPVCPFRTDSWVVDQSPE